MSTTDSMCLFSSCTLSTHSLCEVCDASANLGMKPLPRGTAQRTHAYAVRSQLPKLIFPTSRLPDLRSPWERALAVETQSLDCHERLAVRGEFGVDVHVSALIGLRTWCGSKQRRQPLRNIEVWSKLSSLTKSCSKHVTVASWAEITLPSSQEGQTQYCANWPFNLSCSLAVLLVMVCCPVLCHRTATASATLRATARSQAQG